MWIRLRQIAVVAQDLFQTGLDIGTVLGLEPCYTDPEIGVFGLKNMLWPIGDQFLEVVTPTQANTAAGRYRERRSGDTGYMVITQVDDVELRRRRAAELGIRIAFSIDQPEHGHDGIQLHPADTGGTFFEMDQMLGSQDSLDDGKWAPAGPNWKPYRRTNTVSAITAAEIQSPDPDSLASRWAAVAELDLHSDSQGRPYMEMDNAVVRFVEATDGRGEGLGAIDVTVNDRDSLLKGAAARGIAASDEQVTISGMRINLR